MARIRTIKPFFWKHERLSSLPPETHMLAASLLNYADDEGYFNANPKLVKSECCPLREDSVSVQCGLIELSKIGFIVLGASDDGRCFGRVVNFLEHQRINRPQPSKIKEISITWDNSPTNHPQITEGSVTEWNKEGNGIRKGREVYTSANADEALSLFNSLAEQLGLSRVQRLTGSRKAKLRARLLECGGLDGWRAALEKVRGSPFLRGENDKGWKANFDFLVRESSFTKLMEGAYDSNRKGRSDTIAEGIAGALRS